MAAGLLWILDAGNNTAMEPYRAFIVTNLMINKCLWVFKCKVFYWFRKHWQFITVYFSNDFIGKTGSLPICFFLLRAVCSIGSIWWMKTTKEIPPTTEELEHIRSSKGGVLTYL
jgi:maltose/moltooligosaccharide transporter